MYHDLDSDGQRLYFVRGFAFETDRMRFRSRFVRLFGLVTDEQNVQYSVPCCRGRMQTALPGDFPPPLAFADAGISSVRWSFCNSASIGKWAGRGCGRVPVLRGNINAKTWGIVRGKAKMSLDTLFPYFYVERKKLKKHQSWE